MKTMQEISEAFFHGGPFALVELTPEQIALVDIAAVQKSAWN